MLRKVFYYGDWWGKVENKGAMPLGFLGEYDYKIDVKGRIALPVKFREGFREGVVLAPGLEKCIRAYPLLQWQKTAERLADLPLTDKTRKMSRFTFATAFSLELDTQGRIALPPPLREYAGIKDMVIVAGVNTYLELWNKETWEQEKALMLEQAWQITESLETRP
jgi:MraZ protein